MIQIIHTLRIEKAKGISLAEYSILIGLIGVLGIFGLQTLGGSLDKLLSGSGTHLEADNTLSVLNSVQQTTTATNTPTRLTLKGSRYYTIVTDPHTGMPTLKLSSGANGVAVNTTSMDGNFNTLGTMMLANALDDMAQNETDPEKKAYYTQLADLSFYLGGAEGEMDSVPNLDLGDSNQNGGTYTRGDALRDINSYRKQLQTLMNNPPESLSQQELLSVLPFATDAYNISQSYVNAYGKFLRSDGSVPGNFGMLNACSGGTCPAGNGKPGSSIANADKTAMLPSSATRMMNESYDQRRTPKQVRQAANQVLTDNKVESVPVESTLTDATIIDTQSPTPAAP